MKAIIILFVIISSFSLTRSQSVLTPELMKPDKDFDNIWSENIFSDSNGTSILIWVKESVKLHVHENHTEHIYVMEGSGDMIIGDELFSIVTGDLVVIPQNTQHSLKVTSPGPVKVISFQSPEFLGKDRVFIEKKDQKP